jgi:para-aminobenzoate synthetase / 4-amino-4-deoxychorismate lyase
MLAASRPDPSKGVFETMLVLGGHPVELDAHLERLGDSLSLLFDLEPPLHIRTSILDRAHNIAQGRLRVALAPGENGRAKASIAAAEIEPAAVFPLNGPGVTLHSIAAPGGLGAHKWADRTFLEGVEAEALGIPLLLDADRTVLEAAKGNLFAVADGRLRTPRADGRILPGVTRRRTIELALERDLEVREEELTLEDLTGAEEVFLTGSVGGVEPVGSVDGIELARDGEVSARIGADLRRLWSMAPEAEAAPALAASRSHGPHAR